METILDTWKQRRFGSFLEKYDRVPPIDRDVDFVFTNERIVLVCVDPRIDTTEKWTAAGGIAGPLGMLAAGTVAGLWNAYKEGKASRKLSPEMLTALVENGLAMSISNRGLECEIEELKRSWLAPFSGTSMVYFIGKCNYRDETIKGAVVLCVDDPADKIRHFVEKVLPVKAAVRTGADWRNMVEGKRRQDLLTMRVLGKIYPD